MKYYFTYSNTPEANMPFIGGWTEVIADSRMEAIRKFQKVHPNIRDNTVNCAFIYDEIFFATTGMLSTGNFGKFCQEVIDK